jgi:glycosyltransferase involved in cell wall biosynthesis
MRILIANDGVGDTGGVHSYLDAVAGGLAARGHQLALLHRDAIALEPIGPFQRNFSVAGEGIQPALDRVARWGPELCFSHNMNVLDVDRALIARWPVVKFMHGYFGTCIGGQKRFGFPVAQPCDRRFGAACLALYGLRHCGELEPRAFVRHYRWACDQHGLLPQYRALVVASQHMKREFVRNGVESSHVEVNPLFPTHEERPGGFVRPPLSSPEWCVAFVGRMTLLKGGDLLVDAIGEAAGRLGRTIRLLLIGDGPQRIAWERRAEARNVPCTAPGWLTGDERWRALRQATLLALPSSWPEPFGLVGLEAAALGIPAVAFDVGGIREWLQPGVNGLLASAEPPRSSTFADALVEAFSLGDGLDAMGARAAEVAKQMSLARHIQRLDDIFHHAHSARR